jgi:hypothetical protein
MDHRPEGSASDCHEYATVEYAPLPVGDPSLVSQGITSYPPVFGQ